MIRSLFSSVGQVGTVLYGCARARADRLAELEADLRGARQWCDRLAKMVRTAHRQADDATRERDEAQERRAEAEGRAIAAEACILAREYTIGVLMKRADKAERALAAEREKVALFLRGEDANRAQERES